MRLLLFLSLGAVALMARDAAAQPAPRFEVASIKQDTSDQPGAFRATPGGRFEVINRTLRDLIFTVYQRFNYDQRDIVGGPSWMARDRFDIIAQTGSGTPAVDADGFPRQLLAMFRALLEERFHLVTHFETHEGAVYFLEVAHSDRRLGPNLKRVDAGCDEAMKNLTGGRPTAPRPGRGPDCAFGGAAGALVGSAVTLPMLGRVLGSWELHRPVIDRTGLTGSFDVDLHYRPEITTAAADATPLADAPSIFTAVEEQLGLKLVSGRGPIDVQVVDRADKPSEN